MGQSQSYDRQTSDGGKTKLRNMSPNMRKRKLFDDMRDPQPSIGR